MDETGAFRRLLLRSAGVLVFFSLVVALCYFFVDIPVARFVYGRTNHWAVLRWLTYPPPVLQAWAPVALVFLMIRRAWGPWRRWELILFAACVNVLVVGQFKDTLKFTFGRYWPDTWIRDNPSLLQDDAYGFHPFQAGPWYDSFPSGHTARTVAIVSIVWIACSNWLVRGLCILATALVVIGLIGMDYHFVGDCVAGGCVGGIVGMYTTHFCGLRPQPALTCRAGCEVPPARELP
jgi:membrane-associated phospholipid phosphatase